MTKISKSGYKRNSKDKKEKSLIIPSSNITMKNVDFPVFGVDNLGNTQMMYPGIDYTFPGEYVYEVPMARYGGDPSIPDLSEGWLSKYQTAGQVEGPKVVQSGNGFEYGYSGDNVMMRPIGQKEWITIPADKAAAVKNLMPGLDFDVNKLTPDFQAWKKQAYAELEQKNQEEIKAKRAETIQRNKFKTNPGSKKVVLPTVEEPLPAPVSITNRYPGMVTPKPSALKEQPYLGPDPIKAPSGFTFEDPAKKKLVKGNTKDRVITYNQEYKDFVYSKGDGTYDPSNQIPFFGPESDEDNFLSTLSDYAQYWYEKEFGVSSAAESELETFEEQPVNVNNESDLVNTPTSSPYKWKSGKAQILAKDSDVDYGNPHVKFWAFKRTAFNDEGMVYIPTPRKENWKGKGIDKTAGMAHFLIKSDLTDGHKDPETINSIKKSIANNQYLPIYKKEQDGKVRLKYIKGSESLEEGWDYVAALRQEPLSNIDWSSSARPYRDGPSAKRDNYKRTGKGMFGEGISNVLTKDGKDTWLVYKDANGRGGKLGRFNGNSLVFIIEKNGERIIRDFTGTVEAIEKESINLLDEFGVTENDITLAFYDQGSYTAKPKADKKGFIPYKNYNGFNTDDTSGAGLAIPFEDLESMDNFKMGGWLHKYQDGSQVGPRIENLPPTPTFITEAQRQKVEATKQGNRDQWGRPYDNEWYGFDPSTKQFTVRDAWGRAPQDDWYGFDPYMKAWSKGTKSGRETPPYGYVAKEVPGTSGSMMTVYVDPKTGDKWVGSRTAAQQQASRDIAASNNIDPIGLGILMASGAGPAVRTAAAAMPWLNAPAVLPYIGEVPWLTATNVLGAYGAAHSTQQILDPSSELRTNPNAENILMTGLGYLGLGIGKKAMESGRQLGKSMFNTPKLLPGSSNVDELVDLWRIQERGARPMSELAAEGKLGPMFQNEKAIQHFKDREKYFGQWFTKDKADFDFYKADREFVDPEIIQLQVPKSKLAEFQKYDKTLSRAADREFVIPLDQQKLFTPTQLPGSANKFKSEIDWGKWNSEIPSNKALMDEYNTIEQTTKANGSWMKNPDGSPFQGTPEQFVQQNSQNFKNAFGNSVTRDKDKNFIKLYHGSRENNLVEFLPPKELIKRGLEFKPRAFTDKNTTHTFFSPTKEISTNYGGNNRGKLHEVYANIENPLFLTDGSKDYEKLARGYPNTRIMKKVFPFLKEYDAMANFKFGKNYQPGFNKEVAIPYGNNVKSAIGNNGMFDMSNPNIYKALVPTLIGTGAAGAAMVGSDTPQYKYGGWLQKYQTAGPVKPTSNFTLPSLDPQAQQAADYNKGWEAYNAGVRTWTELLQEKEEKKGRPLTTEEKQAWLQKAVKRNDGRKTTVDPNDPKWNFLFKDSYQTWDPEFGPMTVMSKPIEVTAERTELDKELAKIAAETRQAEISNPFNKSLGDTAEFSPARMKRASQNANDQVALRILNDKPQGDRNRVEWLNTLTPQERSIIERSQYAGKLDPDFTSQFSQGFEKNLRNVANIAAVGPIDWYQGNNVINQPLWTNSDYTQEEAANASAMGVLAPLSYPTNLVTGALTGDFGSALQGQTSMPLFTDYRQPGFAATMSGLGEAIYDPMNAVGIGLLEGTNIAGNAAKAGKYLTEGPLKNVYKYNPKALKETPEVILHRLQKPGQTEEYIINQFTIDPFTGLPMSEAQPGVARGFSSDPLDMLYYNYPTIKRTRGYTGDSEILRLRMPREELKKYNLQNYNKAREDAGLSRYSSKKPDAEFILPIEDIIKAEKFTGQDIDRLLKEAFEYNNQKPHWLKGYKPVDTPTQLPGSANTPTVTTASTTPVSWSMQDLPGLHLKSTMSDGPISKIIEPKTGLVNVEQALGIIGKESSGADKVALIKQSLGETLPKKMDYNDFRKLVQDQLIPLDKTLVNHSSDYGLKRLGYKEPEFITRNVNGKTVNEMTSDIIENQTLILSNKNKFGRGSDAHSNPEETLGHIHFLIDAETPDIITATQVQSDAFQGTHRIMPKDSKNLTALEGQQKSLERMEQLQQRNKSVLNKMKTEGVDEAGVPVQDYQIKQFEQIVEAQEKSNLFKKAEIENFTQKSLLDKNHQERFLQELVNYAGERGDITKLRLPTSETAARIQNYRPITQDVLGPNAKAALDKSNSFDEFFEWVMKDTGAYTSQATKEEIQSVREIYDGYKSGTFNNPVYEPGHKTILKKYSEQPKTIKKLFGVEPRIVTDNKGNTWYEFDIPEGFKGQKGEIKAYKYGGWLNKYQGGGAKEELSKFIKQPVDTNDLRYVGNQQAVTDNTRVVVPNIKAAKKEAPAVQKEIQRVKQVMEDKNLPTPADVYAYEASPPEGYVAKQVPGVLGSMMTVYVNPKTGDQWQDPQQVAQQQASMDMRDDADQLFNSILFPTGAGTFYGASNIAEGNFSEGALQLASALPLPFLKAFKVKTPKQVPNFVNNNVVNTNVWNSTLEVELDIVKQKLLDLYKNKASAEELQNVSDELTKLINIKNSDPRFKVVPRKEYSNSIKDLTRSIEPDSYSAIRFEGEPVRQGQLYDVWKDDYPNLINWKELGLKDASRSLDDFLKFRAEDYDRRDELLNYIIGPRQNKYGGSSKYQAGGDMPFDLPLRSANPGSPWAYESPQANGYLLPDVNRPQLLNTGATEYKMGVDDVTIPTVVNGQYMSSDDAYARYLLTGEQFKPMVDPHSYSAFYDTVEPLGLMKRPDGGGVFNNSINKKHNLKTSAEGYYAYINGVTLSKGGSPKSWLDKYK